jgi:CelD/BcsL family acetyltransferase involved in cellulose biosynthesis
MDDSRFRRCFTTMTTYEVRPWRLHCDLLGHLAPLTASGAMNTSGESMSSDRLFPNDSDARYDVVMSERDRKEREGLAAEVAFAAGLSDADRIRILRDLLRTADAIRKSKSPDELRRDEEVRRILEEGGRVRYIALCERLG